MSRSSPRLSYKYPNRPSWSPLVEMKRKKKATSFQSTAFQMISWNLKDSQHPTGCWQRQRRQNFFRQRYTQPNNHHNNRNNSLRYKIVNRLHIEFQIGNEKRGKNSCSLYQSGAMKAFRKRMVGIRDTLSSDISQRVVFVVDVVVVAVASPYQSGRKLFSLEHTLYHRASSGCRHLPFISLF